MGAQPKIDAPTRGHRIVYFVRRATLLLAVVVFALFVRRYDVETLAPAAEAFLPDRLPPGSRLLFRRVEADTLIARGTIVEAEVTHPANGMRGLVLCEVYGVGGQVIDFAPRLDGQYELLIDGMRTFALAAPMTWIAAKVDVGPLPADHFILLAAQDGSAPDARQFGPVPRSALRRKLIASF